MTADFFANQRFKQLDVSCLAAETRFAFTIDVEEWFQVGAFETTFERSKWSSLESRAKTQTTILLELLAALNIKATFFTLGWIAEKFPETLKEIVAGGHRLACHGMDHQRLYKMTQTEFAEDIQKAKGLIEQHSQTSVVGYRAPSFSLTPEVWWVYEELEKAGFGYSSSLYPVKTDHYGALNAPRTAFHPIDGSDILEIPMSVCDLPLKRLPASGGGYFRLLPYFLSKYMLEKAKRQTRTPSIFYMHPWELDTDQPYIKSAPRLSRFRHYTGQAGLPDKLTQLSKSFKWAPVEEIYAPLLNGSSERQQC